MVEQSEAPSTLGSLLPANAGLRGSAVLRTAWGHVGRRWKMEPPVVEFLGGCGAVSWLEVWVSFHKLSCAGEQEEEEEQQQQ